MNVERAIHVMKIKIKRKSIKYQKQSHSNFTLMQNKGTKKGTYTRIVSVALSSSTSFIMASMLIIINLP